MSLVVLVEVQAIDRTANLLILQHTLSTITKGNNRHALTTNGHSSCKIIHLCIAYLWCDVTMCPSIQDTRTIDTEQDTQTSLIRRMVHVSKSIHTTLRIIVNITQDTIYNT